MFKVALFVIHQKDVKIQSYDAQGDVDFYLSIFYIIFQQYIFIAAYRNK